MTNPYFDHPNSATRFIRNTLARADDINARLDEVSEGFDEVTDDLALKAPLASPTFTGTVTASGATTVLVPTPASLADDSTKAATTAWVQDVIGANTTLLPTQTGHANEVLKTDGTVASWDTPYPRYSIFSAAGAAATPVSSGEDLTYGRDFSTGLANGAIFVKYSNSLFIADAGIATDKIATSPDGEVWTLRTMPSSVRWRVATDGTNSLATAWNSTAVAISTNGTTWTSATALGAALAASGAARPAVLGTTWIAGSNGTTTYTSANHGASWSAQTLPGGVSSGFFVVDGKFWYHNTGTTAYYSTTGATGSWTSSTLPITPALFWVNPDGTVCFSENTAGAQVYECTSFDTYTAAADVTIPANGYPTYKINGVWASINTVAGSSRTHHVSGPVQRLATVSATAGGGAATATVFVVPGTTTPSAVLSFTTTSWPTGLFEI